jgi:hypothetical protein
MKRFYILLVVISGLIVTGCGGGGGGENNIADDIVKITTDAKSIAYKSSSGQWINLSTNTQNNYTLNLKGNYKVALKCSNNTVFVFALNTDKDKEIYLSCDKFSNTVANINISGSLKDSVNNLKNFVIAVDTNWNIFKGSYSLKAKEGKKDILAITYNTTTPSRFTALRDRVVDNTHTKFNINFTNTNSVGVEQFNYKNVGSTISHLTLITKNDTYFTSFLNGKWYYPKGNLVNSDYFVNALKINSNNVYQTTATNALKMQRKDIINDISYINPLNSLSYSGNVLSGLSIYTPDSKSPTMQGYITELKDNKNNIMYILISNSYLDGEDDYIIDDIQSITGFSNTLSINSIKSIVVSALMLEDKLGTIYQYIKFLKLKKFDNIPYIENEVIELATQKVK